MKMNRMHERYTKEVAPALLKSFGFKNVMQVPRIEKVVVNIGLGEALDNPKALEAATSDLMQVTGQKPVQTKARRSIANFKLREGRLIGTKVTLRGDRMWSFLDRLLNIALPRVRDFRGVSANAFDGRGNYTLGIKDQLVFPEIEYDKIDKLRGMEVTIVTSAKSDEQARALLQLLGMPFGKSPS
jgi:large subunit ribosomal protein L5